MNTKLTKDTSTESIDFHKSVGLLPNMMDSESSTQVMLCMEPTSNKGTYIDNCDDNDTLVIDNKALLDPYGVQENLPEGRRIVDIAFMWSEIHRTFNNHARGIECQFKDWKLINSRRRGLMTQLFFQCQMCHYKDSIWSEPTKPKILDINTAVAAATITTGIGYAQLNELCAAINVPCMSESTYITFRDNIVDDFQKTAMENMKMAGEIEKQLALERNDIINGIPYITVVADGSWMKRTYGNAYNSLSGIGAIIGYYTKKVLFVGVRNKFCAICDMAERKGVKPRIHKCYKNFDRNASSTRMESDAIAEGFKCSLEMHGLIYKTVIADGDSSVYQTIHDNKPYCEQMVTVKKIECSNHLLRNLCKKLKAVAETTQPKAQKQRGFVALRNVIKNNILNIRKEVEEAAKLRRKEQQTPQHHKAIELQQDILNIPSHIFGEHKRCESRGRICTENGKTTTNYVPHLKSYGLYERIEKAISYLSCYSDSLLLNFNNNPAESFNSIICKEIGGKRINFGKRGSYNARIAGAIVQYNTQQVLTQLYKSMDKIVPPIVENLEKQRQIKVAKTRESREAQGMPKKFKGESGTDRYYGPQSQKPDLSSHVFEQLRQNHLEKLLENAKNWQKIELDTRNQSKSELWLSLRREMLTASNFGTVCRMRSTTSCAATVKAILYPPYIDNAAIKYGRDNEEVAKKELALQLNKEVIPCGLFIDTENPCLGASPDGLIDGNGLVEIKCPLSAENLTVEKAIETLPSLKAIFDKKNPQKMNQNHRYYYQIQGQLNITQREYCIFAVWTPKSMKILRIDVDNIFWKNQMLPFLTRFYNECMLPEILDSRHNRHMPIRNPRYIIEAKEEAAKKILSRTSRRKVAENENGMEERKRLKPNISPMEAAIIDPAVLALHEEQDDDCIIVSYSSNKRDITEDDMVRHKKLLDDTFISFSSIKKNVLPITSQLNDESLDQFLRIIRETSCFETQSVLYLQYPHIIEASHSDKSLQIIGGNCSNHWRCIFFDGTKLRVYDSLPGCTYDKLVAEEKNYIHLRYPKVNSSFDITFEKVQTQPDGISCGIYAAAFATTIVLGGNPCEKKYSKDVKCMREHFCKIIESNKLLPFPK
ncbi:uncharacterized protein [Linepithema humile]